MLININMDQLSGSSGCTAASGTAPLLGADRDALGCIGSAGYVWSPLLQTSVRPWEAGERLLPAAAPQGGSAQAAAYVIRRGNALMLTVSGSKVYRSETLKNEAAAR